MLKRGEMLGSTWLTIAPLWQWQIIKTWHGYKSKKKSTTKLQKNSNNGQNKCSKGAKCWEAPHSHFHFLLHIHDKLSRVWLESGFTLISIISKCLSDQRSHCIDSSVIRCSSSSLAIVGSFFNIMRALGRNSSRSFRALTFGFMSLVVLPGWAVTPPLAYTVRCSAVC